VLHADKAAKNMNNNHVNFPPRLSLGERMFAGIKFDDFKPIISILALHQQIIRWSGA
jgi:hypothetical protein